VRVHILGQVLVAVVAAIHLYIVLLEMVLWRTPRARRAFGTTEQFAADTAVLAANQGLYNGFLAAGLIWGMLLSRSLQTPVQLFFLICVAVAGLYGAATVSRRILFVQTVPAVLAGVFVVLGR
jgi:putative membrane protein